MVAGVASRRDFEGIVTGLDWVDRTASCCGLGKLPGLVAASADLSHIGRL